MTATDPWIDRIVDGRFRLRERIGAGGMGAVYIADQLDMQRPVVVKVIRPEWASDPQVVARFRSEAQIVARLSHPNVVQVFATGEADGALWMAMEYIDGVTLGDAVRGVERFDELRAAAIGEQIAAALAAAHAAGVVHRDLKPANVMLSALPGRADHVKVLDFGIARSVDGGASMSGHLTGTGVLVGTPAYMSPEQIEGHPLDGRSDLYALGLILYEMVSGTHPFDARTPVQWVLQHLQTPPPPLAERAPLARVSPSFDAIMRRCLAKRPNDRFESAEQVRQALAERVSEASRPVVTQRTGAIQAPPPPTPARWSRAGLQLALVAAGVLGLLVAAGWGLTRVIGAALGDADPPPPAVSADAPDEIAADGPRPPASPENAGGPSPLAVTPTPASDAGAGDAVDAAARPEPQPSVDASAAVAVPAPGPVVAALPTPPAPRPKPAPHPVVTPSPGPSTGPQPSPTSGFGPANPSLRPAPAVADLSITRPDRAGRAPIPAGAVFESDLGSMRSWRVQAPLDDVVAFYRGALAETPGVTIRHSDDDDASVMNLGASAGWTLLGMHDEPEGVRITVFIR